MRLKDDLVSSTDVDQALAESEDNAQYANFRSGGQALTESCTDFAEE